MSPFQNAENYVAPVDSLPFGAVWIGKFSVTSEAKEIVVPEANYTQIRIELVSGAVSLNTVWLRPEKTEVKVAKRLQPNEVLAIDLGESGRTVNGLRISDNGGGEYKIYGMLGAN